jgi:O-methyltransferase domain
VKISETSRATARVSDPNTDAQAARFEAQKLAFAPMMFQAARAMRDLGVLSALYRARALGQTAAQNAEATKLSLYATELLLEAGYASGLCSYEPGDGLGPRAGRFVITKMGVVWLKDRLTRVNAEFSHHVCYKGAFHMHAALKDGLPRGLAELGPWETVYEGLSSLSAEAQTAWFDFDHFYSDGVFEHCLEAVLGEGVRTLVDIGANTGRFTRLCLAERPNLHVTMVDLPQQLALAEATLAKDGLLQRTTSHPVDIRSARSVLPVGGDAYWMSQFLDCFSEQELVSILTRVRAAMPAHARAYILETFWDQQTHEAARYCVIGTSLYFACMANGNSRMYHSGVMRGLIEQAGLVVESMSGPIGLSHTLVTCKRAE